MDAREFKEPTYELHTRQPEIRWLDDVQWEGEQPEKIEVNVSGLDFDEAGVVKWVRVKKGEIVDKYQAAGALRHGVLDLLALSPESEMPLQPRWDEPRDTSDESKHQPLERTLEAKEYDKHDWPGGSGFHPPHLRDIDIILKQTYGNPEASRDEE